MTLSLAPVITSSNTAEMATTMEQVSLTVGYIIVSYCIIHCSISPINTELHGMSTVMPRYYDITLALLTNRYKVETLLLLEKVKLEYYDVHCMY